MVELSSVARALCTARVGYTRLWDQLEIGNGRTRVSHARCAERPRNGDACGGG
jgi:hypothetical protein